jgi:16S rRNA processing protein RimM
MADHLRSGAEDPPFVVVGQIAKPHGTKGEFYVWPLTDRPGSTFAEGVTLRVADVTGNVPDPDLPPLVVTAARAHRKGHLVSFEGIEDRGAAELLHGRYLVRPFAETEPLDEGEIFYHQLLGLMVETEAGERIGPIVEVYHLKPRDLIEVEREGRTLLIPFHREVVRRWDLSRGTLTVRPPEGLLDL